ncbi:MAG: nitronate monooxygenase [Candidatus Sericytochromatia bacterium]|nr:nitronate monooxygenase [Candidatus Sericytochromatia bacterium]
MQTAITDLFQIRWPIIQAGMVWVSGGKLAAAAANAGGLGLVGGASMDADLFRHHLRLAKSLITGDGVFGVNIPIFFKHAPDLLEVALAESVRIFFMSGGSPTMYTPRLKEAGCTVVHVLAAAKHARKAQDAGCDAVVAEGFEAGGHNSPDETTTLVLIPQVVDAVRIPVIAAGGIADGRGMAAAFALGAAGVQVGTRFAATVESSAHVHFKQAIVDAGEGDTRLVMKKLMPVRLKRNAFAERVMAAEAAGATKDDLSALLGRGRAKLGIHDGDLAEGEIEIGQIAGMIRDVPTVSEVMQRMVAEYQTAKHQLP